MTTLTEDLQAAAGYGGHGTGVTRVAWSEELAEVYEWLSGRMRELGLEVEVDAAGNLFGKWQVGEGKPFLVGSHLDTVPSGGRYDGVLGVLSALEAIRLLQRDGVRPRRPIWLVSFMDEEGTRFGAALFGSRAFVGVDLSGLADRRDAEGTSLREAMARRGFDFDRLPEARRVDRIGGYLELHIEQGPVLEEEGLDIGVVTGIVGVTQFRVRLTGAANHAGTTPMHLRRDALVGAARIAVALRDEARGREGMTANVGKIMVEPGGANVVPGLCEFTIDVRAPDAAGFAAVQDFVRETTGRIAEEERLELDLLQLAAIDPQPLAPELVDAIERAAELEGASRRRMPSGAGHDAQMVGAHVPAAMVFVPSRGGISHSPDEFTDDRYCDLGARVVARTLRLVLAD